MGILRNALLWASENPRLRRQVPNYSFVKKAVKRFMPGETVEDAIDAAKELLKKGIPTVFTYLGENINELPEAQKVTDHYIEVLRKINRANINTEISLKLTSIGLDISYDQTFKNFSAIVREALKQKNFTWIDIEGSQYTQVTIDFYKQAREEFENVGLCLQAYLYRTEEDIEQLMKFSPAIRLVKGAYNEPPEIAFRSKSEVDENYFKLSEMLLDGIKSNKARAAFATHDLKLIDRIKSGAEKKGLSKETLEFQMLYGIKPNDQIRLVEEGHKVRVLISYGEFWYPWYVRRLAERPANLLFVLKNLF